MLRLMIGAATAVWLLCASTAGAAEPPAVKFNWAGETFAAPIPAGYCVPTGAYIDLAATVAKAEVDNETLVTLYDCAAMSEKRISARSILIKGQRRAVGDHVTRAQLLNQFKTMPKSDLASALATQPGAVKDAKGKDADIDFKMDMTLQPVAADDFGVYVAGLLKMQTSKEAKAVSVAFAITAIRTHPLLYYVFNQGTSVSDIAAALDETKAGVRALVAANEPGT